MDRQITILGYIVSMNLFEIRLRDDIVKVISALSSYFMSGGKVGT